MVCADHGCSKGEAGLDGTERTDIVNVKLGDSMLADILTGQPGYFRGYHIARSSWISILLDGTVPFEEICRWIDESYGTTASKQKKQKIRPPKEWLVPANPKYYDIVHAFDDARGNRLETGQRHPKGRYRMDLCGSSRLGSLI